MRLPIRKAPRHSHGRHPDSHRSRSGLFGGGRRRDAVLAANAIRTLGRKPQARARGIRPPFRPAPRHAHGRRPDSHRSRSGLLGGKGGGAALPRKPQARARGIRPPFRPAPRHAHGRRPDSHRSRSGLLGGRIGAQAWPTGYCRRRRRSPSRSRATERERSPSKERTPWITGIKSAWRPVSSLTTR